MRLLLALALLVVGAGSGVAAAAVHGHWWGLALAAAALPATLAAVGPGWTTRLPFAAGFGLVVLWLAVGRPEGDFAVAADAAGYLLLMLTLVVVGLAVVTLPRPGRERRVSESSPSPPRMSRDEH